MTIAYSVKYNVQQLLLSSLFAMKYALTTGWV